MSIYFAGRSDCGLVRQNNEDSFVILPDIASGNATGIVLADGMGGHNKGEVASSVASAYAADRMQKELNQHQSPREIGAILAGIAERANVKVYLESLLTPQNAGMGTTLTLAFVIDDLVIISHVGDCRAYLLQKNHLKLLTIDHTLVETLLERGEITPEAAQKHPSRHIITRALGVAEYISADVYIYRLNANDRLLLCTDGLYGFVSDNEIKKILAEAEKPDQAVADLIAAANQHGGGDNVTVVAGFV